MTCGHETHTDLDPHGLAICLDCSALIQFVNPSYLSLLLDWWDTLEQGDEDPGDCSDF